MSAAEASSPSTVVMQLHESKVVRSVSWWF